MNKRYRDSQGKAVPYHKTAFHKRRVARWARRLMAYGILNSARSQVGLILASDMPAPIKKLKVAECTFRAVEAMKETLRGEQ